MKLFAMHSLQNYDLSIPSFTFLARNRIRKFMRIRTGQKHADPDPKPWLRLHKYVEHYLFKIKKKKLADSKYVT